MEDIDGGLHPAVDEQSLDEDEDPVYRMVNDEECLSLVSILKGGTSLFLKV